MKKITISILVFILPILVFAQQTGEDLIAASIKFHDPEGNWSQTMAIFNFSDTRPGKKARAATLYLNNVTGTLCLMREEDGVEVTRHIINDKCSYDIDGNFKPSAEEIDNYTLNDKRSLMLRNYYLYLWGLPMKLTDSGTRIDADIYIKEFNGKQAKTAKVTYDAEVGSDIWYFYFNPETSEMIGYQFFHDEAKGDGEYIVLSGSELINNMKIPKNRAWYTNPDSTLLGTDKLVSTASLVHSH